MRKEKKTMERAARKAGRTILKSFGRARALGYKEGAFNLLTKTDLDADKAIHRILSRANPGHGFLSEEGTEADSATGYTWVIDPLDGTTNFAYGIPYFCISIALYKGQHAVMGCILDPLHKEYFFAQKGKGARLNGKKMRVSKTRKLKDMFFSPGFVSGLRGAKQKAALRFLSRIFPRVHTTRRLGASALELAHVACGRLDGCTAIGLHPWDGAAGALLVREAGGRATNSLAKPWRLNDPVLLATNGKQHRALEKILGARQWR